MKNSTVITIMFTMCICLMGCDESNVDDKKATLSEYSLSEFKTDLAKKEIHKVDLYYLSYSINFDVPVKKEDFINGYHNYKISLNTFLVKDYREMAESFLSCPLDEADRGINETRLACDFFNSKTNKYLRMYFSYDLKRVEIKNKSYNVTKDFVYSVLMHLPKKSYEYVDNFYQETLKKIEYAD